jgi:hypothetical protein
VRKSNRLGALPTLDRFPARREGIHLPQTRAQISAKAEAVRTKILEDEAAKANLEASQREELQSLMADKISTMQPVPIDVPSSPEHMEVNKEEAEQEAIKDAIIDVASSDVEDALHGTFPCHLPTPQPRLVKPKMMAIHHLWSVCTVPTVTRIAFHWQKQTPSPLSLLRVRPHESAGFPPRPMYVVDEHLGCRAQFD